MDIGKNFTFVMEDEAWIKKVLIGGAGMLLLGLPTLGYLKQMFRNAVEGQERPLPEWDNFVGFIVEGIKAFVIILAYELLLFVVYGGGIGLNIVAGISGVSALRYVGMGCSCLALPIGLVVAIMLPTALMRFFVTDSIGAAFQFGEVIGFIKANLGQYLLALVLGFVCYLLGALGMIACGVGVFFTMPYTMMVAWKNFADVYRNAQMQASPM